jgi:hypothetical protein
MARKVNPPRIAAQTINRSSCIVALRCAVQPSLQEARQIWLTNCYREMPADCANRVRAACPASARRCCRRGHRRRRVERMRPSPSCAASIRTSPYTRTTVRSIGLRLLLHRRLQSLDGRRRELRPIDLDRQLVEFSHRRKWRFVFDVVDAGERVKIDVEALVPLQDHWLRLLHSPRGDLLAVYLECAGAGRFRRRRNCCTPARPAIRIGSGALTDTFGYSVLPVCCIAK